MSLSLTAPHLTLCHPGELRHNKHCCAARSCIHDAVVPLHHVEARCLLNPSHAAMPGCASQIISLCDPSRLCSHGLGKADVHCRHSIHTQESIFFPATPFSAWKQALAPRSSEPDLIQVTPGKMQVLFTTRRTVVCCADCTNNFAAVHCAT